MRGESSSRQLRLLQLMEARSGGVELEEAARELGAGRRTVYRDFEVLQTLGIPLVSEQEGKRARWRILDGYRHRLQLSLTWSEVLALSTGAELMKGLAGTLFHEGAVSALEKIRATLPKPLAERVRASEAGTSASRGGHDYSSRGALLQRVVGAISQKHSLRVRYRSRVRGARRRSLDPYHVRVTAQGIYLVGFDHEARIVKTYLLDRFDEIETTEQAFEVAATFDPEKFLGSSFSMWGGEPVRVRLVVSAEAAQLMMERKVHSSQLTQKRSDGSVEVSLQVPIVPPLIAWLAGLGSAVTEVEPASLREALVQHHLLASSCLERHGATGVRRAGGGASRLKTSAEVSPAASRNKPSTSKNRSRT